MKWFKSKKQKRIEELEKENSFLQNVIADISNLKNKIDTVDNHISDLKFISPYKVYNQSVETIMTKIETYPDAPMSSDDIEARLTYSLAEGVAKHMVVYKYYDPEHMKDIYSAMVKVVALPKDQSWANQLR